MTTERNGALTDRAYHLAAALMKLASDAAAPTAIAPTLAVMKRYRPTRHSPDFTSVYWHGSHYRFTACQAHIVRILWDAYENDTPDVRQEALLDAAGSESANVSDLFKDHPAWSALITSRSKGSFRLTLPAGDLVPSAGPFGAQAYQLACELMRLLAATSDVDMMPHAFALMQAHRPAKHSHDFTSVYWHGTHYRFTASQAQVVRMLWAAWDNATPDLRQETLLDAAGSESANVANLFKDHPAWGTLIRSHGKGVYRLNTPEEATAVSAVA